MAQLRDSKTSNFIAEGTPLQMATLAVKIGVDEVIFDDVGTDFDLQLVLDNHSALKNSIPKDADADYVASVQDLDKLPRGAVKEANEALHAARSVLDRTKS